MLGGGARGANFQQNSLLHTRVNPQCIAAQKRHSIIPEGDGRRPKQGAATTTGPTVALQIR